MNKWLRKLAAWYLQRDVQHIVMTDRAQGWLSGTDWWIAFDFPVTCPIAGIQTRNQYYCTREPGHDGPCAAVPCGLA